MIRDEHGRFKAKHGYGHRHPTYKIWWHMMSRCNNPRDKSYRNYGGRGIKVCQRWHNFIFFLNDMGHPPRGMQIERLNNELGYFPDNCCWATRKAQARNKRNNKLTPMAVRVVRRLKGRIATEKLGPLFGVSGRMVRYVLAETAWSTGAGRASTKKED